MYNWWIADGQLVDNWCKHELMANWWPIIVEALTNPLRLQQTTCTYSVGTKRIIRWTDGELMVEGGLMVNWCRESEIMVKGELMVHWCWTDGASKRKQKWTHGARLTDGQHDTKLMYKKCQLMVNWWWTDGERWVDNELMHMRWTDGERWTDGALMVNWWYTDCELMVCVGHDGEVI